MPDIQGKSSIGDDEGGVRNPTIPAVSGTLEPDYRLKKQLLKHVAEVFNKDRKTPNMVYFDSLMQKQEAA